MTSPWWCRPPRGRAVPANRALLARSGTVVWLRAEPEVLARRVGTGAGRPLSDGDPASALAALDEVRRPLYESVASVVVDVDACTPDEAVEQILAGTGLSGRPA